MRIKYSSIGLAFRWQFELSFPFKGKDKKPIKTTVGIMHRLGLGSRVFPLGVLLALALCLLILSSTFVSSSSLTIASIDHSEMGGVGGGEEHDDDEGDEDQQQQQSDEGILFTLITNVINNDGGTANPEDFVFEVKCGNRASEFITGPKGEVKLEKGCNGSNTYLQYAEIPEGYPGPDEEGRLPGANCDSEPGGSEV